MNIIKNIIRYPIKGPRFRRDRVERAHRGEILQKRRQVELLLRRRRERLRGDRRARAIESSDRGSRETIGVKFTVEGHDARDGSGAWSAAPALARAIHLARGWWRVSDRPTERTGQTVTHGANSHASVGRSVGRDARAAAERGLGRAHV